MNDRPNITKVQWHFLMYYCGGNLHPSRSIKTQDSLEGAVAAECYAAGLIKKKPECETIFCLTDMGRSALYLDVESSKTYEDRSYEDYMTLEQLNEELAKLTPSQKLDVVWKLFEGGQATLKNGEIAVYTNIKLDSTTKQYREMTVEDHKEHDDELDL